MSGVNGGRTGCRMNNEEFEVIRDRIRASIYSTPIWQRGELFRARDMRRELENREQGLDTVQVTNILIKMEKDLLVQTCKVKNVNWYKRPQASILNVLWNKEGLKGLTQDLDAVESLIQPTERHDDSSK
jgi:hypothetical protein